MAKPSQNSRKSNHLNNNKPKKIKKSSQSSKSVRIAKFNSVDTQTKQKIDGAIGKQIVNYFYNPLQLIFLSGEYKWNNKLQRPGYQSPLLMLGYTSQNLQDVRAVYSSDGQRSSHSHINRVLSQICENDDLIANQLNTIRLLLRMIMSPIISAFPIAYYIYGGQQQIPDDKLIKINQIIHPWDKLYKTFEQNLVHYAQKFVRLYRQLNPDYEEDKINQFRKKITHIIRNQYQNYNKNQNGQERKKFQTLSGRWIRKVSSKTTPFAANQQKNLYYWHRVVEILNTIIPQVFQKREQLQIRQVQTQVKDLKNLLIGEYAEKDHYEQIQSLNLSQEPNEQQKNQEFLGNQDKKKPQQFSNKVAQSSNSQNQIYRSLINNVNQLLNRPQQNVYKTNFNLGIFNQNGLQIKPKQRQIISYNQRFSQNTENLRIRAIHRYQMNQERFEIQRLQGVINDPESQNSNLSPYQNQSFKINLQKNSQIQQKTVKTNNLRNMSNISYRLPNLVDQRELKLRKEAEVSDEQIKEIDFVNDYHSRSENLGALFGEEQFN